MVSFGSVHTALYFDTSDAVDGFLASIGAARILALDTEGASFHRYVDRIYLLQLSTREQTAILDPLPIGTPRRLGAMLEDPNVEIVFHDADYDLRLLQRDYGWRVRNIFDTRIAAQLVGIRAFGLAALLEQFFGLRLDKKHQRADWSLRPLTPGMLDYAAQDTMHLLGLRDRLHEELDRKGRLAWADEEFSVLERIRVAADDDGEAFLRIKGARDLDRRGLAVLRELVAWRDGLARRLDKATFRVVGNDQLLEAAARRPTAIAELTSIKGMPRGILDSRGQEVLAAIQRGAEVPENALPRFPKPPRWNRDPDFDQRAAALKEPRDAAARRLDMDPGVLCSRDRLEAVARKNPKTMEELESIDELRRWQVRLLGEDFIKALARFPQKANGQP